MGVTVHFEGSVKGDDGREAAIATARRFAAEHGWLCKSIEERAILLKRVIDERPVDYVGATIGVEIWPHANSEPLRLEFDDNNFCQDYCKTQFAPIDTHIRVIELLQLLAPMFESLSVIDEGEYFESGDAALLQQNVDMCFKMMEDIMAERPDLNGPHRLPSGRIVDLKSDA